MVKNVGIKSWQKPKEINLTNFKHQLAPMKNPETTANKFKFMLFLFKEKGSERGRGERGEVLGREAGRERKRKREKEREREMKRNRERL